MTRNLLLSIHCADDESSYTNSLLAELSEETVERIKYLSEKVGELKVDRISERDAIGVWSEYLIDVEYYKDNEDAEIDFQEAKPLLEKAESRNDCKMLHVGADYFFFTSYPKNLGDRFRLSSDHIKIKVLDDERDLYVHDGQCDWHQ